MRGVSHGKVASGFAAPSSVHRKGIRQEPRLYGSQQARCYKSKPVLPFYIDVANHHLPISRIPSSGLEVHLAQPHSIFSWQSPHQIS